MNIKKVSKKEFLAFWEALKPTIRGTSQELARHPDEPEELWKLRIYEHFNPSKPPLYIDYHSEEGITRFVVEDSK